MIPKNVFYDRRDNHCVKCNFWKGVCLKGHKLSSRMGCPLKKFEPIQGAGYAPDVEVLPAPEVPQPGNCCGGNEPELKTMNWAEATSHLVASLKQWQAEGRPLADDKTYHERVASCQDNCPHYRWFQCRLCKCLVFTKAKLPHEKCPAGRWKQ